MDIYSYNLSPTIENCTFINNTATGAAGAVKIGKYNDNVSILNSVFQKNTLGVNSSIGGGAVYINLNNSNLLISNCDFEQNQGVNAGAVYISRSQNKLTVTNSTFAMNKARVDGGAVRIRSSNSAIRFAFCKFIGNIAIQESGGGFSSYTYRLLIVLRCVVVCISTI